MTRSNPKRAVIVTAVFLLAGCEQPAGPRVVTAPRAITNADRAAASLNVSTSPEYQRARAVLSARLNTPSSRTEVQPPNTSLPLREWALRVQDGTPATLSVVAKGIAGELDARGKPEQPTSERDIGKPR